MQPPVCAAAVARFWRRQSSGVICRAASLWPRLESDSARARTGWLAEVGVGEVWGAVLGRLHSASRSVAGFGQPARGFGDAECLNRKWHLVSGTIM